MLGATRVMQAGCPWQAMRDPFAIAVLQAYRWWKANQLEANCGGAVPEAIRRGVDVYHIALQSVISHDAEREQKRREAEAHASAQGSSSRPRPVPRLARRRP